MMQKKRQKAEREDHVILEPYHKKNGKKGIRITRPSDVTDIGDKEELEAALAHYSKPLLQHLVPDSQHARKHYIERIRPALRYYCKKFGKKVPKWLETDDYYLKRMSDEEKNQQFGTTELHVHEFSKFRAGSAGGRADVPEQA